MAQERPDQENNANSETGGRSAGADETEFGKMVVERDLATAQELHQCLELKRSSPEDKGKPLPDLIVEMGYITPGQRERLVAQVEERRPKSQQIPGYQILEKLGKGAMATVYKARQLSLDRIVAVKVLPRRLSENLEFVDRFYREGKVAAKLNDPNIVQAFDVGEASGYHYFVMEYVDGYTVYDVLAKGEAYSERDALDIVIQIAQALLHASRRDLIHRDVKPKNIMITLSGVAKLADMGLAREVTDTRLAATEAGRAYGTPYYISPEQIRGEVDIDFRADIYSLGATLYHMVTGQVPFDGPNPVAVMHKHLREKPVPPDHIKSDLSTGCAEIIEVMMAKDREDRYQSIENLLEDLKAVRDGSPPVHAREKFNISMLADLEQQSQAIEEARSIVAETGGSDVRLKVALVVLLLLLGLSILVNIVLVLE